MTTLLCTSGMPSRKALTCPTYKERLLVSSSLSTSSLSSLTFIYNTNTKQNPWQASLAILSAFFLTPRPATSSSHPSLTFLGWDKDDDDHHNNHDDQHSFLCSSYSPFPLNSNQVDQEDKDFFNLAFLPAIR